MSSELTLEKNYLLLSLLTSLLPSLLPTQL